MGRLRALTLSQRRVLSGMAFSVVVVTGLLMWSIWSSLQPPPAASPLPTPSAPPATATLIPSTAPTPTATPRPTSPAAFELSRAGIIESEVTNARQVSPRWETPLTFVDRTGMARVLHTHYQENTLLVIRLRPMLTAFRLWFWDSLRVDVVTQSERAASFYSPELRELYLRRDWTGSLEALEIQLAYGYARAVPEHMGSLSALQEGASGNAFITLDHELALQAIAEGDAFVATLLHLGIDPGSPRADQIQAGLAQAICPVWQSDDPLLEDISCIAFELGARFAAALYQHGGTTAMDAAILRPPRSTKHILQPELYLESRATATGPAGDEVRLLDPLQPNLGRGWVLTATDTLGAAMTQILMQEWSNEIIESEAVAGWNGDLLQVWQNEDGEQMVVWQTAWDSLAMAGRFHGQLRDLAAGALVPGLITDRVPPTSVPRGSWWSGPLGTAFLYRYREQIWLIWGADPDIVQIAASEIP